MGDARGAGRQDNRGVVVISPELVLVSSPEDAARARELLPEFSFAVIRREQASSRSAAAVFGAVCVAATLGPLLLAIAVR
jgi:hypothetical protein